ncbi:MAG: hypothetical protein RLZZ505_1494 [Verrucomicrobiota bacterium]|jgi:hypothetical protein
MSAPYSRSPMTTRPFILGISLLCASCDKDSAPLQVDETRPLTTKDIEAKLFATSDERFRNAKPAPVKGVPPEKWLVLPAAQFRELNYRFGASGTGEVYVTLASGSVGDNVNRWRRQFGLEPFTPAEMEAAQRTPIAGTEGIWVEGSGEYASGMGSAPKAGYGLAGVIAQVDDRILTVKMVGLAEEVEEEKAALKTFAASLEMIR